MSYNPVTDFLGLLRQSSAGEQIASVPGLDYVLAALARAGMFQLSVGQTAPLVNQPITAWLKPALPSYTAEGVLYLWNAAASAYQTATPALWVNLLSGSGAYVFQSAAAASNVITAGVTLLAVQRAAPSTTALVLPSLVAQWSFGRKLQIVDFSTGIVTPHTITVVSSDGSTIMQRATLQLRSTADSLVGVMLQPSPDLNSWIIAP